MLMTDFQATLISFNSKKCSLIARLPNKKSNSWSKRLNGNCHLHKKSDSKFIPSSLTSKLGTLFPYEVGPAECKSPSPSLFYIKIFISIPYSLKSSNRGKTRRNWYISGQDSRQLMKPGIGSNFSFRIRTSSPPPTWNLQIDNFTVQMKTHHLACCSILR